MIWDSGMAVLVMPGTCRLKGLNFMSPLPPTSRKASLLVEAAASGIQLKAPYVRTWASSAIEHPTESLRKDALEVVRNRIIPQSVMPTPP